MKKRYYLSMLSLFPLIMAFDCVYFVMHQSLETFLGFALIHFVLFGLINFVGAYFLYKPIDHIFIKSEDTKQAQKRINHLTWYSTAWIFILGFLNVTISFLPFILFPTLLSTDQFSMDKIPPALWLNFIPSLLFVYAIFPAFIAYFLINDFNLDLKAKVFLQFQILYPTGKKRVGLTLLFVFIILGFFPTLLAILDIVVISSVENEYAQFSSISPLEAILVDRFIALLGMIIAIVLITRSFTKPIYSLLKEINKVREGDYSTQAAIISDDEIGLLTKNFNEMVHELETSHNKLEDSNRTLEIKVEERTRELKQMQKQVIVQEKMASLGQMVAGLTHEFNTPIGAICSMKNTQSKAVTKLQTTLENIVPNYAENNHQIKNAMETILKSDQLIDQGTERLSEIINNLKNFVKLDESETTLSDIHESIDTVLALIRHDLLANIEIKCEFSKIPPFIYNARRLNQVFLNLLKNASQAIEDRGEITITTSQKAGMVHVAIGDNGKGIKPEELNSIFDPSFTTKGQIVRTRLGLSICSQIIQEHSGKIEVESQPGKGSVFTVIIPFESKQEKL
jgi:signal transduction histidine kinase